MQRTRRIGRRQFSWAAVEAPREAATPRRFEFFKRTCRVRLAVIDPAQRQTGSLGERRWRGCVHRRVRDFGETGRRAVVVMRGRANDTERVEDLIVGGIQAQGVAKPLFAFPIFARGGGGAPQREIGGFPQAVTHARPCGRGKRRGRGRAVEIIQGLARTGGGPWILPLLCRQIRRHRKQERIFRQQAQRTLGPLESSGVISQRHRSPRDDFVGFLEERRTRISFYEPQRLFPLLGWIARLPELAECASFPRVLNFVKKRNGPNVSIRAVVYVDLLRTHLWRTQKQQKPRGFAGCHRSQKGRRGRGRASAASTTGVKSSTAGRGENSVRRNRGHWCLRW